MLFVLALNVVQTPAALIAGVMGGGNRIYKKGAWYSLGRTGEKKIYLAVSPSV